MTRIMLLPDRSFKVMLGPTVKAGQREDIFARQHVRRNRGGASGTSHAFMRATRYPLRDRDDLKLLTGCTDDIPNRSAHQKLRHRRYEGNRAGLGVRFVLANDTICLDAPIVAAEGHRAPKGNRVR
jgi:hypothetical protein